MAQIEIERSPFGFFRTVAVDDFGEEVVVSDLSGDGAGPDDLHQIALSPENTLILADLMIAEARAIMARRVAVLGRAA